ncbi:MAG: dUTP diphosphatase [Spirochaetaceae bacterium]|nr:MAG: dUTP diphosphatase [Spirochaetaceae bacterium]
MSPHVGVEGQQDLHPVYATEGSAGADLRSALATPLVLAPGERGLIPTGIRLAIPQGYEGQVRPRSGLAIKHGVTVLNAPGTIDSDYRGEVAVILINHGDTEYTIQPGDRVAQLLITPVVQAKFTPENVNETRRGSGGFGSTGR